MKKLVYLAVIIIVVSCNTTTNLPAIKPDVITQPTKYDTDDPAIWINKNNPEESIVFGTDKNTNGGIYAFDLQGNIIKNKCIFNVQRPNNIDLRYGFKLNDSTSVDIIAFTERERKQIRIFSVPDMKPLDNGGIAVFEDEKNEAYRLPMGISLYKSSVDSTMYAIVGRKDGPKENYLYQYKLEADATGTIKADLVRKFGDYSGKKEIEAIAVDDALGFVYYSDEKDGIKKYYAEPTKGNQRAGYFGTDKFKRDIEGIAIASFSNGKGYLIVSDQQEHTFNIFSREGNNKFIKTLNLSTTETDGCDVVTVPLNKTFAQGLFVAMNNDKTFYYFNIKKLGLN
ncbi:phytase [Zhouia sp. PK063]|uniref:phytase n=1 Tax=Zhouia sp. PK063 TaxID=3373602 RepID=UPI0037B4832E